MNVEQLIEKLRELPQDKDIVCQVVGQKSGAWNMQFDFHDIETSWMVTLRVSHPDLNDLDMDWDNQ